MSADIIDLNAKRHPGNGAREALISIVSDRFSTEGQRFAESWAEYVMMELWTRGFKIVPIGEDLK
jgi:hypothetical protein